MGLFTSKKNKKEQKSNTSAPTNTRIPKDVLESIPYRSVYSNGIIEDYDGRFSKSYRLLDTNFDVEEKDKQENMVLAYEKLINMIDEGMIGQLNIVNRTIDQDIVRNNILMQPKADDLNEYREEWNDVFLSHLSTGRNNISKDKIFTLSVRSQDIIEANDTLKRLDNSINKIVRRINHQETLPMTIEDRLNLLYDIYNCHNGVPFTRRIQGISNNGHIDFSLLGKYGISSKEVIAPDSMTFGRSSFEFGDDTFCKTFYIDHLPTQLPTSFLNDITDLPCNMVTSISFIQMNQTQAMSLIKNQSMGMNAQINRAESEAARDGISNAGVVSSELTNARDEAENLMMEVMQRNQKIFKVTALVTLLARSEQELKQQTDTLKQIVSGHLCLLRSLNNREEIAFNTCLPLAQMNMEWDRILTTEASCAFFPFSVQDINQMDGMYYGVNPLSGNIIRYNRKHGANYNAAVFGTSGSGKSFIVKEEISQRYLNSNDMIIIIDPEGEYTKMGKRFGATIIDISLNGNTHINPLDMDMQFGGQGENPIPMKCDAIETLIEAMIGGSGAIGPIEKTIIHRVGQQIYRGYYQHMLPLLKKGISCDKAAMPTLQDFYFMLTKQPEPQAQYLATAIEGYCIGSYSIFAERTNVNTNSRMIIYNVTDMSSGMKELAMHVCLNDAWNHMIENGIRGVFTALYIDEFHLFTKTATSAAFMKNIYKRARKWHGIPTAITQNIGDMFANDEAEAILNNTSFIIMMNQSPLDRATLAKMFNISPSLLEYITDQPFGNGLLYNGTTIVPFENSFPNGKLYELMDSRKKEEVSK